MPILRSSTCLDEMTRLKNTVPDGDRSIVIDDSGGLVVRRIFVNSLIFSLTGNRRQITYFCFLSRPTNV